MSTPGYDPNNPPTQEMYPAGGYGNAYGSGLSRDAYQSQRAYANTPDADYEPAPRQSYAPVEPNSASQHRSPVPKPPSGLAAHFDVNKMTVDIIVNAVIMGIVAGILAVIAETILHSVLPTDWPLKEFGVAFWCAAAFVAILFMVGFGFVGAALDGQSNSASLYSSLCWAFILLAFILFFLAVGVNWVLASILVLFVPITIMLVRVPSIVDNNRLEKVGGKTDE